MDFVDILWNRLDGETELKRPSNILVCFTETETGKRLSTLATYITPQRAEKSSITLLYFAIDDKKMLQEENIIVCQNKILNDFKPKGEKSKITFRAFVKDSDDLIGDILKTIEEQNCNLVLLGICPDEFNLSLVERYNILKSNQSNTETFIHEQFRENEAATLKNVYSLINRNTVSTGIFVDNGMSEVSKIFVPILQKTDVHIFTYVYQIAQKENVKIMVWDAIGIIQSEPKMQKLYQFIVKKTDGRVYLWDDDKKIGVDFIRQQDLVIVGLDGWSKLMCTPLQWKDSLPSTLIIKEKTS